MPKVTGTHGAIIDFELRGVGPVIADLRRKGKDVANNVDLAVIKMGAYIEEEVKESIAGARSETRSVDTGRLINSIEVKHIEDSHVIIAPKRMRYPGSKIDTQQVATILEYGTSRISARRHFRNTEARNIKKVRKEIDKAVQQSVK